MDSATAGAQRSRCTLTFSSGDAAHPFHATSWVRDGVYWITAQGHLDTHTASVLGRALRQGRRRGARQIAVDLRAVTPADPQALEPHVQQCHQLTRDGISVSVIAPTTTNPVSTGTVATSTVATSSASRPAGVRDVVTA